MAHPVLTTLAALVAVGYASGASAQGIPTPAEMPAFDPNVLELGSPAGAEAIPAPMASEAPMVAESPGRFAPLAPLPMNHHEALSMTGPLVAATESSGTWLRRGLWYADLDAVVMARTWDSTGMTLAEEYDQFDSQSTTGVTNAFAIQLITQVQREGLSESSPGYDGSARLSLGRFLFRDQENRDHTFDMTVFGGAELVDRFGATAQLLGANEGLVLRDIANNLARINQGLQVSSALDGSDPGRIDDPDGLTSFDGASTSNAEYASRFHSWEWNYNMNQRMRKDRMELQPSGEWVRRASPGFTWSYLAGLRYFDVEERLDWSATEIRSVGGVVGAAPDLNLPVINSDTDGFYDIDTSNNLFGMQLGAGMTYESDRWNVTVSTKHGFYVNDARATASLTYTNPNDTSVGLNNYANDLHENGVSYLTQGSIVGRYHLRPNFSLRAGWEFMYVTGLALAPNQIDFNPAQNQLSVTGDAFYHGVSFGTEYYW